MIFSPSAAVAALRRSKYDRIEWDIAQSIGENSYPIIGGWGSWIGGKCNAIARWPKVAWAFASGSSSGLKDVEPTEIPSGMSGTQYETDLHTMRSALREKSDAEILKWTSFCKFRIGESYRHEAVENHLEEKIRRGLILPNDTTASASLGDITPSSAGSRNSTGAAGLSS